MQGTSVNMLYIRKSHTPAKVIQVIGENRTICDWPTTNFRPWTGTERHHYAAPYRGTALYSTLYINGVGNP